MPNYNTFTSVSIHSFTSGCPEVASYATYLNATVVNPQARNNGAYISTLKEVAYWRFDNEGAVMYYDAWVPNLSLWVALYSGVDFTNLVVQKAAILTNFRPQIMERCMGKESGVW